MTDENDAAKQHAAQGHLVKTFADSFNPPAAIKDELCRLLRNAAEAYEGDPQGAVKNTLGILAPIVEAIAGFEALRPLREVISAIDAHREGHAHPLFEKATVGGRAPTALGVRENRLYCVLAIDTLAGLHREHGSPAPLKAAYEGVSKALAAAKVPTDSGTWAHDDDALKKLERWRTSKDGKRLKLSDDPNLCKRREAFEHVLSQVPTVGKVIGLLVARIKASGAGL